MIDIEPGVAVDGPVPRSIQTFEMPTQERPNNAFEPTPLGGEEDRVDFESGTAKPWPLGGCSQC